LEAAGIKGEHNDQDDVLRMNPVPSNN